MNISDENILFCGDGRYFCLKDEDCELSLCGCECYRKGFTPEETGHVECGTNCPAYNITGCKCVDNTCTEIGTYIIPEGHSDIR